MFLLSQLADLVLLPSNAISLLGLTGLLVLLFRWRRSGIAALSAAALFGWTPLGRAALVALENRFPASRVEGPVAGIILLGGAVETHISHDRQVVTLTDAAERVTTTAELARRYPDARLLSRACMVTSGDGCW